MSLLRDKIDCINHASPNLEDFLSNGFDQEYAREIGKEFNIFLNQEVLNTKLELLDQFNKYVNFKTFSVFGFRFINHKDYEDFIHIGYLDVDYIIVIKSTSEIAILNSETSEVSHLLAKNFESFLDLLPVLVDYDKLGYLGEDYTNDVKKNTIKEIKDLLLESNYYSFFVQSIPING